MSSNDTINVFQQSQQIYDQFRKNVAEVLCIPVSQLGHQVLKPSQLLQMCLHSTEVENIVAAMRSPIYDRETGKLIALSMDANGDIISEAQFNEEQLPKKLACEAKQDQISDLCNNTNNELKELAAKHGLTVSDLYLDINKRGSIRSN